MKAKQSIAPPQSIKSWKICFNEKSSHFNWGILQFRSERNFTRFSHWLAKFNHGGFLQFSAEENSSAHVCCVMVGCSVLRRQSCKSQWKQKLRRCMRTVLDFKMCAFYAFYHQQTEFHLQLAICSPKTSPLFIFHISLSTECSLWESKF